MKPVAPPPPPPADPTSLPAWRTALHRSVLEICTYWNQGIDANVLLANQITGAMIDWPLYADNGKVDAPSYSWEHDTKSGFYRIGLNNIGFSINGTKLWDLASAAATLTGTLNVTGAVDLDSTLLVNGAVTLDSTLSFSTAASRIIPGATSLSLRNNANSADNLLIADAGGVTFRAGLSGITTLGISGALTSTNTTDATSINTGSIITDGGVGIEKALWVGGLTNIAGAVTLQSTLVMNGGIFTMTADSATLTDPPVGVGIGLAMSRGTAALVIRNNSTGEALLIEAGDLRLDDLLDLSNGSGGQIKFPASQNASTDSNTLDDYKDGGTWTPSVGGNATYTTQLGRYGKFGKFVYVYAQLVINVLGTGSTTTISGLPFTIQNSQDRIGGMMSHFASLATSVTAIWPVGIVNSTTLQFGGLTAAAAGSTLPITVFGNGTRVEFCLVYEASA